MSTEGGLLQGTVFEHGGMFALLGGASLACAAIAAAIVVWYLVRRPPLTPMIRVVLLLGIAVFPIGAALTGNVAGYEVTQTRRFCGSCHVMTPYTRDAGDPDSHSLAAIHARNPWFGDRNCYVCHSDYGMFGTVATKIAGMKHVYEYYARYQSMPVEQALREIELYNPFDNRACMQCHTTRTPTWAELADHRGMAEAVRAGRVSCVGGGCHGPAHPFSKRGRP